MILDCAILSLDLSPSSSSEVLHPWGLRPILKTILVSWYEQIFVGEGQYTVHCVFRPNEENSK